MLFAIGAVPPNQLLAVVNTPATLVIWPKKLNAVLADVTGVGFATTTVVLTLAPVLATTAVNCVALT